MADLKISQLPAATTPVAGTEVLPIVQSATTKKVSIADLTVGRSITTAGASLDGAVVINESGANVDTRIEGDTDANLFFVDASTDRIGIGTNTPDALLNVDGVASFGAGSAAAPSIAAAGNLNTGMFFPAADTIGFAEGGVERMRIDSAGNVGIGVTPFFAGGNGGKLMIGNPAIDVGAGLTIGSTTTGDIQFGDTTLGTGRYAGLIRYEHANDALVMWTSSSEKMRITSAGNLGLGVTPSAWGSSYRALQVGPASSLYGIAANTIVGNNAYNDGTNLRYITSSFASLYVQNSSGEHLWNTAPTGTAGNTISFTQAMTLTAAGNLGIGTTSPAAPTHIRRTGGSTNSINVGLIVDFAATAAEQVGAGTAIQFRGKSSGGNLDNYQQAMIATNNPGTNNAHGLSFYIRPSAAVNLTESMRITNAGNVGIGTSSPTSLLHLNDSTLADLKLTAAALGDAIITGSVTSGSSFTLASQVGDSYLSTTTNTDLWFGANNAEKARLTTAGNYKIGGTANRATTEGTNQLVIFNGTAPVGTLANGVSFYSAAGEANVMDAAGNATLLSPHDQTTNEWIFRSKHTPTGKVLRIDVERLLKFVNDHFGLDAVHEFIED